MIIKIISNSPTEVTAEKTDRLEHLEQTQTSGSK